jgi:hypothetical protein
MAEVATSSEHKAMKPTITELLQRYRALVAGAKALPPGVDRAQIYREAAEVEDTIVLTRSNSIGEVAMKLSALLDQADAKDATVIADVPGSRFATSIVERPSLPFCVAGETRRVGAD